MSAGGFVSNFSTFEAVFCAILGTDCTLLDVDIPAFSAIFISLLAVPPYKQVVKQETTSAASAHAQTGKQQDQLPKYLLLFLLECFVFLR